MKLRGRWEDDFSLYRLQPYNAGKGYYSYTSNSPRVLIDKLIGLLTGAKLHIRVPISVLTDDERRIAANAERFFYGALNLNDERLFAVGLPSLREQMTWYAINRGSFFIKTFVYKNEKGKTITAVSAYDPYNVAYGQAKDGLDWIANTRKISREQAKNEFNIDVTSGQPGSLVDAIDYTDTEKYGTIIDNKWAIPLTKHDQDYNPVSLIRVGAMPPVWQKDYDYTGTHIGESALAGNRNIYPLLNKTLSDLLTIVRRGVKPPIGVWSVGGTKTFDEDVWQVEKGTVIPLDIGDMIKPLFEPTMPADTGVVLQIIMGELQRAGVPHTSYGEIAQRLSGFAIMQLHGAIETVLQPFLTAVTRGYETVCPQLLQQFVDGKFLPIYVKGRTSRNEIFGLPKAQKIKGSDLKGDWHPEVSLLPTLPKDDAQNFYLANLARQGMTPLLSDDTIRDTMIGVEDPDLEAQKIAQQWAEELPIPKLYEAYLAALADGRSDIAENILGELRRLLAQLGGTMPGGGGGRTPTGLERAAGETPGAGTPAGETGLPSQVMPGETQGGMPPGAQTAKTPAEGGI